MNLVVLIISGLRVRIDRASSTRNALDGKLVLHRTNTITVNAVASSTQM